MANHMDDGAMAVTAFWANGSHSDGPTHRAGGDPIRATEVQSCEDFKQQQPGGRHSTPTVTVWLGHRVTINASETNNQHGSNRGKSRPTPR